MDEAELKENKHHGTGSWASVTGAVNDMIG